MKYKVQYSQPTDTRIAVSEWIEKIVEVEAQNPKEAIQIINKRKDNAGGTWMVLDCWPV